MKTLLLGLIAALLAAILITILGWWSAIWIAVLISAAVIAACLLLFAPVAFFHACNEAKLGLQHRRLVESLPPIAGDDEAMSIIRDVAVWDWINRGRPGDLATFVGDHERRVQAN